MPATCSQRIPRRTHLTGTFNLFVKDRIAFRLSGAYSVQSRIAQRRISLSSKPFKTTCARRSVSTLRNPETSTAFAQLGGTRLKSAWELRATSCERARSCSHVARSSSLAAGFLRTTKRVFRCDTGRISAQAETEAFKLEKRSFGGFCETRKPFEEPCPRMRTPWPGLISRFHWLNT